jgi:hypothetical protein
MLSSFSTLFLFILLSDTIASSFVSPIPAISLYSGLYLSFIGSFVAFSTFVASVSLLSSLLTTTLSFFFSIISFVISCLQLHTSVIFSISPISAIS